MDQLLTEAFLTALVAGAVTAGVPLLLAGLGEQISERVGVLNIGLEGMMLTGAYAGFLGAWLSGSLWAGYACGLFGGMVVAGCTAILCVRLGLDQIVVGIGLTLGAQGLTALLHHAQFSRSYPRLDGGGQGLAIPVLAELPVIGRGLFTQPGIVYLAVLAMLALAWLYRRTHLGLTLEAAGDHPAALDAAGVDVARTRAAAVMATGAFAGLGGAFMAEVGAGIFVPFMTNGAGFMAIVLAMLAGGRPSWVLGGAVLIGACLSMTTALQVAGVAIPTDIVQMLPYLAVMLVLILFGRGTRLPAALGRPYVRGAR